MMKKHGSCTEKSWSHSWQSSCTRLLHFFRRDVHDVNLALVDEGGKVLLVDFAPWLWIIGISRQSWHWAKVKIMAGERENSVVACCLAPCSVLSAQGFFLQYNMNNFGNKKCHFFMQFCVLGPKGD